MLLGWWTDRGQQGCEEDSVVVVGCEGFDTRDGDALRLFCWWSSFVVGLSFLGGCVLVGCSLETVGFIACAIGCKQSETMESIRVAL